jgi:FG-GAP-like repeat
MRRFRFSIASLLGVVLFISVSLAALRASTDAWDSGVFGLSLLILLTAILLVIYRTDRQRASWLGFSLFGWAYLVISLIPPLESRLPTTRVLAYIGAGRTVTIPLGVAVGDLDNDGQVDLLVADTSTPNVLYINNGDGTFRHPVPGVPTSSPGGLIGGSLSAWRTLTGTGGTAENFVRIGHSILALVLAFLGGQLSRWLYDKNHVGMVGGDDHPTEGRRRP